MTLSTFPTFLAFLTFGLVRTGWLKLVTTKTGGRAIRRWQVNSLLFFGTSVRKVRKARKGVRIMTAEHLSDLSDLSDTEAVFSGSCRRPSAREFGRAARICVRYTMSPSRRLQHRRSHASR